MTNILLLISYTLIIITLFRCIKPLRTWINTYNLYGKIPFTLVNFTFSYAIKSLGYLGPIKIFKRTAILTLILFMISHSNNSLSISANNRLLISAFLSLIALLWQIPNVSYALIPPSLIVLGSSKNKNIFETTRKLKNKYPFLRVITFCHPFNPYRRPTLNEYSDYGDIIYSCYFISNKYEWRSTVFSILDTIPTIVIEIDEHDDSESVLEEIEWIKTNHLSTKTIRIGTQSCKVDHLLKKIKITNYDMLESNIKKMFKNKPHLDSCYRNLLTLHLIHKNFSYRAKYPRDISEFVYKIDELIKVIYRQYLDKFDKNNQTNKRNGILLATIPTKMDLKEKTQYMQQNRIVKEAHLVIKSALEYLDKFGYDNILYNKANLYNKLGSLYLQTFNYDLANQFLKKAIEELKSEHCISTDRNELINELGTAYFHRGDIHFSLYIQHLNEENKDNAIKHYKKSLEYDKLTGMEFPITNSRLIEIENYTPKIGLETN